MKIDWQWPAVMVFCVVFIVLGVLVALGKLHTEVMIAMLTWLAPGPWQNKKEEIK